MDMGINNKIALVTGASKNIGRSISLELAREGAKIIAVSRDIDKLLDLKGELGQGHNIYSMDLMANGAVENLTKSLIETDNVPDIIVHNLGGSYQVFDPFASSLDWMKVWQFNLGIVIDINRTLIPHMIKKGYGRIVLLSTLATKTYQAYAPYVSAKSALNSYLISIGREIAKHNVIMSAVSPGAIYTEGRYFSKLSKDELEIYYKQHLPVGRLGTANEIAKTVTFLCSEHAGFMTGSIIGMDGGGM